MGFEVRSELIGALQHRFINLGFINLCLQIIQVSGRVSHYCVPSRL